MDPLPLVPFDEMSPADYDRIGLKCGLEVHQQLLTRSKLFCRCPAGHYSNEYDAEVLRHMRPTLSEMGEYDGTALMEKKTRKNIIYRLNHRTVCTYEFDDTPPFPIDDQAIDIALELALLLKLNLVQELHVARKQYLDGSIPTGFQRTTILGINGWLPFKDRRIGVRQLGLEEDSCREVSDRGHDRTYITDRLGMPLIEVVTEPDMRTPEETAEACQLISKLCRSTQKVRRGYGATRQDVNVSVAGGTRIEIKGVPQIWRIPHLIYNEASRQVALLKIRDELHARNVTAETLQTSAADVTALLEKTSYAPIRAAVGAGLGVKCVCLGGFAGLLNRTTQEHTSFAKEFSDRVRVIACLTQRPNMIHSDAASESLWAQDWQKLRKRMKATDRDALILVWGDQADTETARSEIEIRAREATVGVPSDTRQPLKDGTNGFERVLPGADRMYPDTDLPPIELVPQRVQRIRAGMPEYVWETQARFLDAGMVPDDAERLCISQRAPLISEAMANGVNPMLLGVLFSQRWRAMRRAGLRPERLTNDALLSVLQQHTDGKLAREGVFWIFDRALQTDCNDPIETTALDQVEPIAESELNSAIDTAIAGADLGRFPNRGKLHRWLMGQLMRTLVGRVAGRCLHDCLSERLASDQVLSERTET
jgi:glutamyl-tRNA(Gln) amidotransferase subunit E